MSKNTVQAWMEQEAQWYSEHYRYPVSELAADANNQFDFHGQFSEDYAEFMQEKRWNQAERLFKRLHLPMNKDAEE